MSFLNRTINKIDTTISRAMGGINRSALGARAASTSRSVVDSTSSIAAGSYAQAKAVASDVVSRSGIRSARGYGMIGGGAAIGAGVGAYRADSRGDSVAMGAFRGGVIGGGLTAGGILVGGAYKSAKSGALGTTGRGVWGMMNKAATGARTEWGTRSILGKYQTSSRLALPANASPSRYAGFS